MGISERDKYLTEAMGGCWHELNLVQVTETQWRSKCKKCKEVTIQNDFSTPDGFFKLWKWALTQKWWTDFIYNRYRGISLTFAIIDPDLFADTVYVYLKESA